MNVIHRDLKVGCTDQVAASVVHCASAPDAPGIAHRLQTHLTLLCVVGHVGTWGSTAAPDFTAACGSFAGPDTDRFPIALPSAAGELFSKRYVNTRGLIGQIGTDVRGAKGYWACRVAARRVSCTIISPKSTSAQVSQLSKEDGFIKAA